MPEKSSRAQTGLVDWEEGKKEGRPLKNSLPRENYQDWRLVVFQLCFRNSLVFQLCFRNSLNVTIQFN